MQDLRSLSIVVPLYNEEENVIELHNRISNTLDSIQLTGEIIYVNDGSTDRTWEKLEEICKSDDRVVAISFSRNYGQTAAIQAGFHASKGDIIITLDGDLQNDPSDIPLLLKKLSEGYDIVSGWRVNRQDSTLSRKIPSMIANWLIAWLTGVRLHDYGCSLKAYRANVVKEIQLYGEMHRFIPALASIVGSKVAEIPVKHHARTRGISKYGISRTPKVFLDLLLVRFLLRYRTRPLHILGGTGLITGGIGLFIALYLTIQKIFLGAQLAKRPLLILAVMLILVGLQLLTTGILADLVMRTYFESQGRHPYWIRERIGRGIED